MDQKKAKEIADYIFKDIFGKDNPFTLDEIKKRFGMDIPTIRKVRSALSDSDTWTFSSEEKVASQEDIAARFKQDEWLVKRRPLNSTADILKAWTEIDYLTGEKYINSTEVGESDGIYNSNAIFRSVSIFDSKNIVQSYKLFDCNYMLASRDDSSCTLGIRVKESIFCSSNFEVSWSNKVSKSMFIHDCFDLYECLFCSHLRSKKYCIANMQFEKEEYFKVKQMVIDWILKD